jgi:ATP-dependent helicase/nuclease subunit A
MSGVDATTALTTAQASDPAASAWVAANAGSGKTFVLSRRVIRLLLAGVDPARILCLTFTKAAAAEMAKRVFAILAAWSTLPETELATVLQEIEGGPPDAGLVARARRLFARALDTPGGLKIHTIHAFCERLLHQFPFEANVAGHFEVLDERNEEALVAEARRNVLARAASGPDAPTGGALNAVLSFSSDATHEVSVKRFVAERDRIRAWTVAADGFEKALAQLRARLELAPGETVETVRRRIVEEAPLDHAGARRLMALLDSGKASDRTAAQRMAPFVQSADPEARADAWTDFILKDDGTARANIVTAATRKLWPGLEEMLDSECARLEALVERLRTAELYESSVAMLRLADAAIGEYERLKQRRGVLDFDDLVVRTVALLSRADAARWVQYKLDRGLDHILVDEAQDTSPRQWQVVRALAEEFFAGEGARPEVRTIFAVGDEKQSIFSFQGAVPAWFTGVQREFATHAGNANLIWRDLELHLSFRSVPAVLEAVDRVFAHPDAHKGLTAEPKAPLHTARRQGEIGRVVLWPLYEPPQKEEPTDWVKPVDYLGQQSPEVRLAKRLAATIRGWLDRGETLDAPDKDGKPRPIRAGGILILVRSRGALTDAINRQLKTSGIPIAGADRMTLPEHIAVMDLTALARVVLLPEDDLSLAAVLKSPLVGLGEDALYALAHGRHGWLWDTLARRAVEDAECARAKALIDGWRAAADRDTPHAFFARILGPGGGRKALLRRLGSEAEDVLDEFLALTLTYEKGNVPSLQGFLAWLEAGENEVKRDTDTLRDEVRVMTVHGAKGLEADVVFLVDNGTWPSIAGHDPKLLPLDDDYDPRDPGPHVWMRSIKAMPRPVKERVQRWRLRSEEEYRRLLYVGMTRARDRLYMVGISKRPPGGPVDTRWHALTLTALGPDCVKSIDAAGEETLEWRPPATTPGSEVRPGAATGPAPLPEWTARPAPAPDALVRLTPSTLVLDEEEEEPDTRRFIPRGVAEKAATRGTLIHRLLQSLPDIAPAERAATGARYLETFAAPRKEWSAAELDALLAEVLAVLGQPAFAPVFAPGSRSEVDLAGTLGAATVSGRVDRLAVTAERVLIVDYKTNRPAPETIESVPDAYLAQLALYRLLLRRLYPGREVAAALLWTDRPALMEIPAAALDKAESRIATA